MVKRKRINFLLLLITLRVEAKHLGTYGHTFDILEKDLLEVITQKLNDLEEKGLILKHQANIQKKMEETIKRPAPVEGIIKTIKPRVFTYDPSIKIPYDLKDNQGNIFAKAGTVINPLESQSLQQSLIFIDGDDKVQVQWALQRSNLNSKIILVKGAPFDLMEAHSKIFYFDQSGRLVKKFGIRQAPAKVSQASKILKIEEILIKDIK